MNEKAIADVLIHADKNVIALLWDYVIELQSEDRVRWLSIEKYLAFKSLKEQLQSAEIKQNKEN